MHDDAGTTGDDLRATLKDELWGMGVSDERADAWIERWAAEAARRGLDASDPAYWSEALAWIDAERGD